MSNLLQISEDKAGRRAAGKRKRHSSSQFITTAARWHTERNSVTYFRQWAESNLESVFYNSTHRHTHYDSTPEQSHRLL
jgi:hypothetical protein